MGELWGNYGELWRIMGNYEGFGGIMGIYGGIMGIYGKFGQLWGVYGEWGKYGESWGNYGVFSGFEDTPAMHTWVWDGQPHASMGTLARVSPQEPPSCGTKAMEMPCSWRSAHLGASTMY